LAFQNQPQSVPLLDLKAQYKQVGQQIEALVVGVLRSGNYILGDYVKKLESAVASICGTKYGVGVANGTDALVLALWAANVGPGDEVITPAFTFAATAEAIGLRGAKPVFVDVDPITFNVDPEAVKRAITAKTRAIIPVHLYGHPADMEPIMALADRFGITVIEDNAQAIGASYKGKPTGSFGHMACISFYPTKNLGAAGDAGMVVTDSQELAERLKTLRAHGSKRRYYHEELGVNSRLDEVQAAALVAKLPYLKEWNAKRNEVAKWYNQALKHVPGIKTPEVELRCTHVFHQYTIRIQTQSFAPGAKLMRDQVAEELSKRGIGNMIYYPVALHRQAAFSQYGYKQGDFPVSEMLCNEVISLPMYPELEQWQVKIVASALQEIMSNRQVGMGQAAVVPGAVNGINVI
jgi:dTDP-4-amino-4,6-dideoxygalactose transaminase